MRVVGTGVVVAVAVVVVVVGTLLAAVVVSVVAGRVVEMAAKIGMTVVAVEVDEPG
jgi:hypothetical protein